MAKKGKYSVDEMLGEYAEKRKKHTESRYGSPIPEDEPKEQKRAEPKPAPKRDEEQEYDEKPARLDEALSTAEKIPKQMVKGAPLILFAYALRALAIAIMLMLMMFIIFHNVMGKKPVIDYFSVIGDSFIKFCADYMDVFLFIFGLTFGVQAAYYVIYRVATGRWKEHPRETVVYAILFSIIGIIGSAIILWALKLY